MLTVPLAESSAITLATSAQLVSTKVQNVVCVRGALLDVYAVEQASASAHLVHQQQTPLVIDPTRPIQAICAVRPIGAAHDLLLVAHAPATLSLHAWQSNAFALRRVGTWAHEKEPGAFASVASVAHPDLLRVDPSLPAYVAWVTHETYLHLFHFTDKTTLAPPITSSTLSSLRLGRICDMQFLYGCSVPTLLVLHETLHTWAGRYASVRKTRELALVIVDQDEAWIVTTRIPGISDEVTHISAVPVAQLGGALLWSRNGMAYWSHTTKRIERVLSVNAGHHGFDLAAGTPPIDLATRVLTLDQAYATLIDIQLLCTTLLVVDRHGAASLLHIDTPRGTSNGVSAMRLEADADDTYTSVPQGCIGIKKEIDTSSSVALVFVFSRMGPSQLLAYRRMVTDSSNIVPPVAKRARLDASSVLLEDDLLLLAVDRPAIFRAQVCDQLMGAACAIAATHLLSSKPLELLQVGGMGVCGAALVHSRQIVAPVIDTIFALPNMSRQSPVTGCWSLEYAGHTLLVFSTREQTIVIQTATATTALHVHELHPFHCAQPTLAVSCNPHDECWALQVCSTHINLAYTDATTTKTTTTTTLTKLPLSTPHPVVSAQIAWPHVLLRLTDDTIHTTAISPECKLEDLMPHGSSSASCILVASGERFLRALTSTTHAKDGHHGEEDDELERLLKSDHDSHHTPAVDSTSHTLIFIARGERIECVNLHQGTNRLLFHLEEAKKTNARVTSLLVEWLHDEDEENAIHTGLPTLVARTNDDRLWIYQAHIDHTTGSLCWVRINNSNIPPMLPGVGIIAIQHQGGADMARTSMIITGNDSSPSLLVCVSRGRVRVHVLRLREQEENHVSESMCVTSFTDEHGAKSMALIEARTGQVSMGALPRSMCKVRANSGYHDELDYDSSDAFVRQIVPLAGGVDVTPLMVAPHVESNTTAVVVKSAVRGISLEPETERSMGAWVTHTEVRLLHSQTWEQVGCFANLEPDEVVLCARTVSLGTRSYVALGTSFQRGEDYLTRGRIILLDLVLSDANSDEENEQHAPEGEEATKVLRVGVLTQLEQLPVTDMCAIAPNLLCTCQGSRIFLYERVGERLVGRAFIDAQVYISSVASLGRSWIVYGDVIHSGVTLLYWDSALQTLTRVGRETRPQSIDGGTTSCEFLISGTSVVLVVGDQTGDVRTLLVQPKSHISNSSSSSSNSSHTQRSLPPPWFEPEGTIRGMTFDLGNNDPQYQHLTDPVGHMTRVRDDLLLLTQHSGALVLVTPALQHPRLAQLCHTLAKTPSSLLSSLDDAWTWSRLPDVTARRDIASRAHLNDQQLLNDLSSWALGHG
jgi:hypothetical protein